MWDCPRTSATAGLDRLHRPSIRHQLKDGPSTDKPEIYLYEYSYSPANALGIAVSSFNSRLNNHQKPQRPQRPPRPERPEIVHDKQILPLFAAASSTEGIGISRFPTDDPADFADASSRIAFEPPPRNPRRLLRVRQDSKDCAPAYPYPELQIVTDSESTSTSTSDGDGYSSSPTSNFKLASTYSRRRLPALDQISPPSSPELGAFKNNAPVSPLDDDDADFPREYPFRGQQPTQSFTTQQRQMSHVPVPVHQYTAYQPAPDTYDMSFENPRSLEDVPAPLPQGALPRSTKMRIRVPTDTSAVAQRFRFLTKGKTEPTENLADRPRQGDAPPIHIPRRSSKRASRTPNGLRNISAPLPPIQSGTALETPPRQQAATDRELLPSSLAPKPLNITPAASKIKSHNTNANTSGNALPTPPNHDYPTPLSIPSARSQSPAVQDLTPTGPRIIKRKPPQTHQAQPSAPSNLSSSSPAYINPAPRRASAAAVTGFHEAPPKRSNTDEAWMQPPSRFSVTTYATSNAGTPPQAAVEQMPANAPAATSMMSRPGPFAKRDNAHTPITIPKQRAYMSSPYGTDNQMAASSEVSLSEPRRTRAGSNTESTGRSSILSTAKPLPPAPPELASAPDDRIAQLNASLSALAHRRVNINKSIQQMTELMPRDNLMASAEVLRKREVEKQKVEGLKQELAEIQHEEYDLGLKLHRAYKRQEKDAEFEPTGLWVRRITS
ncbi:hypothetical protein H0G86_009447 [Trichoderma simmonsii]|uniref:Uncharacterized protein n=1 Tax=Trichoderma simmonsii TaxID=1491479 RepID=A0A8G0LHK7_9HYPO|nr:hypothetical protein H0G86_009447 [Trichoderma simmonsii]